MAIYQARCYVQPIHPAAAKEGLVSGEDATYLGIDVGTSLVKAAVIDAHGVVKAVASQPLTLDHPAPGCVEQDIEEIWDGVRDVVRRARTEADAQRVEMVAVTGQGDGCWLVDAAGAPVRPAVSWMDGRAGAILDRWQQEGRTDQIFSRTGSALFPGAQAPILAWLDEHEPQSLDRAATAAYCKDVVYQRLTGERATDVSDASVPFGYGPRGTGTRPAVGARRGDEPDYDGDSLDLLQLGHRRGLLAPVERPLPAATVTAAAASQLGLPHGLTATDGPYDLAACVAGAGVVEPGDGLLIVGTTLACLVPTRSGPPNSPGSPVPPVHGEPPADLDRSGLLLALPGGDWLQAMPAMVGTASLDWALALFGLRHDALGDLLGASDAGAGGIRVLPHFAPSGERAPFVDPSARGQLLGLTVTTTAAEIVRGVCEGLAFAARQCLDAAGLTGRLVACGGGTRSRPWMQLFATALGRPIEIVQSPEVGARGAVASALRHRPDVVDNPPDITRWAQPDLRIEPDTALVPTYESLFAEYLADQVEARNRWHR